MNQIKKVLKKLTTEQWEDLTTGHDLFKTKFYTDMGFPDEFVKKYISEIESDLSSPLSTIYDKDMNIIERVIGIYNLEFLRGLEREMGVKAEGCMGRGREARNIITALQKELKVPLTCNY